MNWKNVGLISAKNKDVDHFTSDKGIEIRRKIYPFVKKLIKMSITKNVMVENYPILEEDTPYIFAASHLFPDEVGINLSVIDRNAYVLLGTTDQIDHNPEMYIAWLNGMIYVNKLDQKSRKECVEKMARVLNAGTSILMFPEGVLNNSENQYCVNLYTGVYYLAKKTNKLVVPMVSHNECDSKDVYVSVGNPIDFSNMEKKEALNYLRDTLSTIRFNIMSHYDSLVRTELEGDLHQKHLEERKKLYDQVKWTQDVWDEEITPYVESNYTTPQQVRESLENVKINYNNAYILAPILNEIEYDKKYDIKRYMKKNWNK